MSVSQGVNTLKSPLTRVSGFKLKLTESELDGIGGWGGGKVGRFHRAGEASILLFSKLLIYIIVEGLLHSSAISP